MLMIAHQCLASENERNDTVSTTESVKGNVFSSVIDYFRTSNVPRDDGRFDISFIGGPHYSSDSGLGVGIVASGVYGMPVTDSLRNRRMQSEVSLYFDITTNGFIVVGVRGMQMFHNDRSRLNYDVFFTHNPRRFWGIGYEMARDNDNYTKYTRLSFSADLEYLYRIGGDFFIGPTVDINWAGARKVTEPWRWDGQELAVANFGPGLAVSLDTRDNTTAPSKGVHVALSQKFFPKFLGNKRGAFMMTRAFTSVYTPMWRGSVLALRLHCALTYGGDVPWTMLPTFGGSQSMRGYYEGQYSDRMETDATVEIRQHVWHRSGIVLWAGMGSVFPKFTAFKWERVLPNGGIGYRWEFKKNSNVRIDLGFGKGQMGFIFNINEAF